MRGKRNLDFIDSKVHALRFPVVTGHCQTLREYHAKTTFAYGW